ncbi:MAG TPA: flagellar basal-body MS-ring/collar protein FliF [Symbiobacteriaceae bacterium]
MKNWAAKLWDRIKTAWTGSSPVHRWLAVGLAVALVLAVGIGLWLNRPQWVVLVSDVEPKDAAAIVARLDELKVPYKPTGDGYTILVPESEVYTAKLALAQAGLPNSGTVGMELFDKTSFGATEFDKRVNLLRAQQGELERALMRISEVEYANVKLAIPEESVFVRDQKPVTAAVLIKTKAGKKLSRQQIEGIVQFVASSVQGLEPENVKVVDQSGRLLSAGLGTSDGLAVEVDTDQLELQRALQEEMEERVQTLLEPIFGTGNVVARVNLELNMDSTRVESQTVEGATPTHTETTQEMGSGLGAGVALTGDTTNVPVYQTGDQGQGAGGQTWRQTTRTDYGLSQRTEVRVTPPGSIKRISVGIAINRPSLTAEQIAQIQQMVAGATGAEIGAVSVIAMAFHDETETTAPIVAGPGRTPDLVPVGVGLALALAVVLFGWIMTRRRRRELEEALAAAMARQTAGMTTGTALDVALGLDQKAAAAAGEAGETVPEDQRGVAPTDGAAARQELERAISAKPRRQFVIGGKPIDDALLQAAEELITANPEAAAAVIRRWIKGGS